MKHQAFDDNLDRVHFGYWKMNIQDASTDVLAMTDNNRAGVGGLCLMPGAPVPQATKRLIYYGTTAKKGQVMVASRGGFLDQPPRR